MPQTLPYGSWPSPISALDVAAGSHPIDDARFVGDDIWWLERMPAEGGRTAIRRFSTAGVPETVLAAPWDVRSRVHEYGGGAWTVDDDGVSYFVEKTDQRVWMLAPGADPSALTPAGLGMRFADLALVGDIVMAVRETHDGSHSPARDIVAVPRDGSAARDASAIRTVAAGSDFVGYPRLSPDGTRLAWIAWDHPRMPWDGTELRVGALDAVGTVTEWTVIAGGESESIVQPEWTGADELTWAGDRSGRWNLERVTLHGREPVGAPTSIAAAEADTGGPLWNLGARWYEPLGDGRIVALRTHGADAIVAVEPHTVEPHGGGARDIPSAASARLLTRDARGSRVLLTGAGATTFGGLWLLDLEERDPTPRLVRAASDEEPDATWLPAAQAVTFEGPRGEVHAFAYPPTNPDVTAPEGGLPPYLVLAHGGPTTHAGGEASASVAYFTSRGIGVLDVNYGGSTGYGREYRERLRGQWGIVDRDDVIVAASGLADLGLADGARLAIRGGSAGGWTVLCALTASDRFAAGISRYGVADLRALAADTHDFEARYLDGLVGPLPEAEQVYIERSPLSHLDRFATPMLIEQGLDDEVVPPAQSEAVRDALRSRGIPHAYLAFEGEGHGFRRAETIVRSLEAELSFLGQVLGFTPVGVPSLPLD